MAEGLLQPADISTQLLQEAFDAAFMETSIDKDGDLVVEGDRFRSWILPKSDGDMIKVMSLFGAEEGASASEHLQFVNRVNNQYLYLKVSSDLEKVVSFESYIPVVGGVSRKNIVLATKLHHRVLNAVLSEDYVLDFLA